MLTHPAADQHRLGSDPSPLLSACAGVAPAPEPDAATPEPGTGA